MNHRYGESSKSTSLAVLVERVVSPLLRQHPAPILFELNIDTYLMTSASSNHLAALIETLVTDSLREMPRGGELSVSGCQTANGVELEIADTGSDAENRSRSLSLSAAALSCKPHWQNCPQGGAAVTIVLPFNSAIRKAA